MRAIQQMRMLKISVIVYEGKGVGQRGIRPGIISYPFGRSQLFDREISFNLTGAEASPVSVK
jgi:hypothetical protein